MQARPERPLSCQPIDWDDFGRMRRENLARWPTGTGVDLDDAVAYHRAMPRARRAAEVIREAAAAGRTLTQPRGGFGTLEMHLDLLRHLEAAGHADILPTTTDSYTRNERWREAEQGMAESRRLGRSMLNGLPVVNLGVEACQGIIDAIGRPAIMLTGTAMPRLTGEITLAAGYTAYLGSGIAYTASYTKEVTIEQGIRNYQYLDRLAALYARHGVEIHRRQPGFLTGTLIPPSIAIAVGVLDCLLAAHQGVTHYGIELGQCLCLPQDVAAIEVTPGLCREYLERLGLPEVFTPVTSLHWMGAWPEDEAQARALIVYGGTIAALAGAVSVTTKSTHEALGIPTKEANAEALRATKMAVNLAFGLRLTDLPAVALERARIREEVRCLVDRVLEMGEGDVAVGVVRAIRAGVLDIPWSPNREVASRVLPARDADGAIRLVAFGDLPFTDEIKAFHLDRLRRRAERDGLPLDHSLAIRDVYAIAEPLSAWGPLAAPHGTDRAATAPAASAGG